MSAAYPGEHGAEQRERRRGRAPGVLLWLSVPLAFPAMAGCRGRARPEGSAASASAPVSVAATPVVHVTFTAKDPRALCRVDDCSGASPISIRPASSERPLVLSAPPGAVLCESCLPVPFPSGCTKMGVGLERVELAWDGSHYELSTCGAGVPCAARRAASPGRYVAELCATRNTRTIDSIGAPVCVDTGQSTCASRELTYPGPDVSGEL